METKMKIKEYANVNEYTEIVDAPYNLTGGEEVLDERPMGFVKGGLQKLGSKLLPGSYGKQMKGQVQSGQKANQLYSDFHEFLGQTGYKSTDTALKAFLQQQGINVDVDSIIQSAAPAPAAAPAATPAPVASKGFNVKLPQKAPTPAPVAESINSLNRILILSGRAPKKIINENKNILNEEITLDRGALNKIFMQVAQQAARPAAGSNASAPAASGSNASAPAASGSSAPAASGGIGSKVAGAVKGAINKLSTPTVANPAASGGNFGGDGPAPAAGSSAPPVEPPTSTPAAGSSAPPVTPPAASTSAPAAPKAPASGSSAPVAPGPLGGTNPGAAAAKTAGAQKQSTQNMNDYVKNVSSQINAAQTKPEKIELAKELINFMSDRKGSPEYDNALGSASVVLKKAGLNNMLAPLKGGQTANQKPQGLRNPPAAPKAAPTAASAPAEPTSTPAAGGFKVGADELNSRRKKNQKDADNLAMMQAGKGLNEDRVLHRNSYIFIKKVLENTNLTLKDLGYRVSISESTSDSITLISR